MSNDFASNKAHEQHGSLTDHICKEFEGSSVCAVSSILSNDRKPRKIFRSLVFLLLTVAFLYQCIAFLCHVLKYPTVVDFEELSEKKFVAPAFTLCNFNPIKRSRFCAKYPNNCTKPDKEFCEKHPRFCGTPDTLILKEDDFDIDLDEFLLLNFEVEDMIGSGRSEEDKPVGPLPRTIPYGMEKLITACFTFNDRVNSPLDPDMKQRNALGDGNREFYGFDPEENEVIFSDSMAGIMFQVHSPFEPVNPFETGIFMRPGYVYTIKVKMTQEELLPYDCLNYTELWLKNNKTGYRSQAACRHKCLGDIVVKCGDCTVPFTLYPYPNVPICNDPDQMSERCAVPEDEYFECLDNCKDDCVKLKFSYEVQESYKNRYDRLSRKNESREITVDLQFPKAYMQKVIHKPQFQDLEIFSLIGGLLAFWIGLSMYQVVEVFDCMFQIVKRLVKKKSVGSESSAA